jgi:transcriptional regulator with XRE-family HTH domain
MNGTTLERWLERERISISRLAAQLGVSHMTLLNLCKPDRSNRWGTPKLTTLALVSRRTGIPIETLAAEAMGSAE